MSIFTVRVNNLLKRLNGFTDNCLADDVGTCSVVVVGGGICRGSVMRSAVVSVVLSVVVSMVASLMILSLMLSLMVSRVVSPEMLVVVSVQVSVVLA